MTESVRAVNSQVHVLPGNNGMDDDLFVYIYFLRYSLVSVVLNVMLYKASSVLVNNRSKKPVHIFNLKKRSEQQREPEKQGKPVIYE